MDNFKNMTETVMAGGVLPVNDDSEKVTSLVDQLAVLTARRKAKEQEVADMKAAEEELLTRIRVWMQEQHSDGSYMDKVSTTSGIVTWVETQRYTIEDREKNARKIFDRMIDCLRSGVPLSDALTTRQNSAVASTYNSMELTDEELAEEGVRRVIVSKLKFKASK